MKIARWSLFPWLPIAMAVAACDSSTPPPPPPPAAETHLWNWLERFRNVATMPTLEEIEKRFGGPNERMEWEEKSTAKLEDPKRKYRRYPAGASERVNVGVRRYHHKGDPNRWVDVILLDKENVVIGWEWFENVPPGQESGPPK
jgi:hypothetical protein